jgi:hypothetical protein
MRDRCYFVYAVAPDGMSARDANRLLNEYVADRSRGVPVSHDHFVGRPHGGFAVLYVRDERELRRLDDPGPLAGWQVDIRPLTFALTPVGFAAQLDFTLEQYGGASLGELAAAEPADPRYWWQEGAGDDARR